MHFKRQRVLFKTVRSPVPLSEVTVIAVFLTHLSRDIICISCNVLLHNCINPPLFGIYIHILYAYIYVRDYFLGAQRNHLPLFHSGTAFHCVKSAIISLHSYLLMDIQIVFSFLLYQIGLIEHPCTYVCTHVCKLDSQGQNF